VSHSQRCISANRFGDGFDCICDQEPLPRALKRIKELEAQVATRDAEISRLTQGAVALGQRIALLERISEIAQLEREAAFTTAEMVSKFHAIRERLLTADQLTQQEGG
jgi:uncharacterized small protein (DUF1192 family)